MKNKSVVKKITAILATACMMVGMLATTAMAKPAAEQTTGSLTIKTSTDQSNLKDYEFDLYKVADITVDANGSMTYKATTEYESILRTIDLEDQTEVEKNLTALSTVNNNNVIRHVKGNESQTEITISGLALGYYLVKVTAPEGAAATKDFLVSVPSTKTDGSNLDYTPIVTLKTSTVDATKKGNILDKDGKATEHRSGNIGDTIKYTIETHVPDTTGFVEYTYTINDTMSKGLQYKNGSLSVSMGETGNTTTIAASNYNLTTTTGENGTTVITLAFNKTLFVDAATRKNNSTYKAGTPLHVTYEATITKDALDNNSTVTNNAKLIYSNNPGTDGIGTTGEIPTNEVKHYTYHIQLNKSFDVEGGKGNYSKVRFTIDNVTLSEKTIGTPGEYVVDPKGTVTNLSLDPNNGTLKIYGLAEGEYYLTETATADGYNLLSNKVKVVIKANYDSNGTLIDSDSNTVNVKTHFVDTSVVNKKGFTLPSTGGQGMVALVAAGICLMTLMAALMALYMKKHRNA